MSYRPDGWDEIKARILKDAVKRATAEDRRGVSPNDWVETTADAILEALKARGKKVKQKGYEERRGVIHDIEVDGWLVFIPEEVHHDLL